MKISSAIAKLEKLGATIKQEDQAIYAYFKGKHPIYIGTTMSGECYSFGLVLGYDEPNQQASMSWRDNLTQVIKAAFR